MSKFLHTVPGAIGKRVSPHVYTHAVVVTVDREWEKQNLMPRRIREARKSASSDGNWGYTVRCATGNIGEPVNPGQGRDWFKIDEQMQRSAREFMARFPAVEDAMDAAEARVRAEFAERKEGVFVVSWHHSVLLADKGAQKQLPYYQRVEVREVVRTPK